MNRPIGSLGKHFTSRGHSVIHALAGGSAENCGIMYKVLINLRKI